MADAVQQMLQIAQEAAKGAKPIAFRSLAERRAYAEGVHAMAAFVNGVAGTFEEMLVDKYKDDEVMLHFVRIVANTIRGSVARADVLVPRDGE